jgi:hypothetical protein
MIRMRKRDRERAVKVLDLVLRFFGPHGENWLQGAEYDEQGRRCLVGALRQIERQHRINTGPAQDVIEAVIGEAPSFAYLNDCYCRSFTDLRVVILKARTVALAESRQPEHPKRLAA